MSLRFRMLFATACATLVVLVFLAYGNHVREEAEQLRSDAIARFGGEVTKLVVAEDALEPGDVLSEQNVRLRDWVADLAPQGALTSFDDVLGREVSVPVAKGAPVTELAFRDETAAVEVPTGRVAVSIPLNDKLGISRNVAAGTRVDAYVLEAEGTKLLAQGMTVLVAPAGSQQLGTSLQLTLAMHAQDVPTLLSASATGDLRLVLPANDLATTANQKESEAREHASSQEEVR